MSTIRTLELFRKTTGPKMPWGEFDANGELTFSFDRGPWVATAGTELTVSACDFASDPLLNVGSQQG